MNGRVSELPSRGQREERQYQPEQTGALTADAFAEHAEQRSKERTAQKRNGGDEPLLASR